jgi:hypothetical protein
MCFVFDFTLHTAYTLDACPLTSILPSLSFIDIFYGGHKSNAGVGSERRRRLLDFHIVVKRVRNSTAVFRCAFCSTDGTTYDSEKTSSHLNYNNFPYILRYMMLPFGMFGCNYLCWGLVITLQEQSVWFVSFSILFFTMYLSYTNA